MYCTNGKPDGQRPGEADALEGYRNAEEGKAKTPRCTKYLSKAA